MSTQADSVCTAYTIAWQEFTNSKGLTPDERMSGPNKLRWYIQVLAEAGEHDPEKIAKLALGMMREYEQIVRSKCTPRFTRGVAVLQIIVNHRRTVAFNGGSYEHSD